MNVPSPSLIEQALATAQQWQDRANQLLTRDEKGLQAQMRRLLTHPGDKALFSRLIDQSFRSRTPRRIADQIASLVRAHGVPRFLSPLERCALRLFSQVGGPLAALMVPQLIARMRSGSSRVIIAGETGPLHAHLQRRRAEGVRMNINHLGEAVLGEAEAARRLTTYINDMENPEIEYISIKISTLFSQISTLAFKETATTLTQRLSAIYRAAKKNRFLRPDGSQTPKFVNLDMEEYRDLELTCQVFITTLNQEEFFDFSAGIVLQAYLPDSFALQRRLTAWARDRVARGGAPVKLRLVKGANMEMERLEAALNNWPLAPYDHKLAVDANFKRMLAFGLEPDNIAAVRLGVASHNLFELAHAQVLAQANGVAPLLCFEMLEGMADHVRRALQENVGEVLLYAPVAGGDEFINAIAYLIRRLDENTAPENFLRHAPGLTTGSAQWQLLKEGYLRSCALLDTVPETPHRIQDRATEQFAPEISTAMRPLFVNEADTDWSLAANRHWAAAVRAQWQKQLESTPMEIPLVVNGVSVFAERPTGECRDPGQPGILLGRYALAPVDDADLALVTAENDPDGWRLLSARERHAMLSRVAMELRRSRGDLLGAAAAETGKLFAETDAEVSEAVDFAEFYPHSVAEFDRMPNLRLRGRGVVLVIAPWNFPLAIPCGGITAALAAGNTVLFKPASAAVLTGYLLCQCFWRAGISPKTLQFLPCSGTEIGPLLTASPMVDSIILTGSTETGLGILQHHPGAHLTAETGGKNATIVTDMADRDQAIKHVLHSAFSNSGQKCSATSLLILEASIYDDPHFKRQLVDATASLKVGPAWNFASKIGPLIRPPEGALLRALTSLEPGEEWALKPALVDDNPHLWSPGIKYGVQPGSFTHGTELFGPVLGVMRAADLNAAIALVNQTGYGLTSGLESLDEREQAQWLDTVRAGNLYINRPTTGAMVLRQPFGGLGKSAIGPGLKAGSLEYVTQFLRITETAAPPAAPLAADHRLCQLAQDWRNRLQWGWLPELGAEIEQTACAITSYLHQMETRYGQTQDFFHLRGQDNLLRFLPVRDLVIRLHPADSLFETLARVAAAVIAGCSTRISLPGDLDNPVTDFLKSPQGQRFLDGMELQRESDAQLAARVPAIGRLRYAAPNRVPPEILAAAAPNGSSIARTPVYMEGRIELLQYLRQQAICHNYHRYGNLGDRALD